jgi:hypothetical protein
VRKTIGLDADDLTIGCLVFSVMLNVVSEKWFGAFIMFLWLVLAMLTIKYSGNYRSTVWNKFTAINRPIVVFMVMIKAPIDLSIPHLLEDFLAVLSLYIIGCSNGPDEESKLKKLIKSFRSSGKLIPVRS